MWVAIFERWLFSTGDIFFATGVIDFVHQCNSIPSIPRGYPKLFIKDIISRYENMLFMMKRQFIEKHHNKK